MVVGEAELGMNGLDGGTCREWYERNEVVITEGYMKEEEQWTRQTKEWEARIRA